MTDSRADSTLHKPLKIAIFVSLLGLLGVFPKTSFAASDLGQNGTGSDKKCSELFVSLSPLQSPTLTFPTTTELKKIMLEEPTEKVGRHMNRAIDRVYVAIAKTDLLKTSATDQLALALVRIIDLQYEMERGHDRGAFASVYSSYQPDMIQDSKSYLMAELRARSFSVHRSSSIAKNEMQSWLYEAARSFPNPDRLRAEIDQNLLIAYGPQR